LILGSRVEGRGARFEAGARGEVKGSRVSALFYPTRPLRVRMGHPSMLQGKAGFLEL
jgi:hypothetical protein